MTFWIIAGLLTLIITVITILPVFSRSQNIGSSLDYDKEIYKARIGEIETERDLGKITEREYDYTLAEEGRRLLALENASNSSSGFDFQNSNKPAIFSSLIALILIPAITFAGYSKWGEVDRSDLPLQARLDADPRGQSIQTLLQRAENQLQKNPSDGRGWLVVAPVYMRLNRPKDAANAFRNAIRILGPTADLQTQLGEAIAASASGVVTEEALQLFEKAAKSDPQNIKPKFFLAIAKNQAGQFEQAVVAWDDLIKNSPENAPWLNVARQQLQLAKSKLNPDTPGNPTQEDIKSAGELSTQDRQDFINSMVDRLAGELQDNPENKPGWRRMIRSLTVLRRNDDLRDAIVTAQGVFRDDLEFLKELEDANRALEKLDNETDGEEVNK